MEEVSSPNEAQSQNCAARHQLVPGVGPFNSIQPHRTGCAPDLTPGQPDGRFFDDAGGLGGSLQGRSQSLFISIGIAAASACFDRLCSHAASATRLRS